MTVSHRMVGTGEHKVIVLHDWFGTSAGWVPFLDYLNQSAFTYALLDYRGYGDRADVPGDYTLAEIAQDALALADQLGWDRFSLVGHSMGGKAIQRVLAEAPHRVRKLAAIAPVPASAFPLEDGTILINKAASFASLENPTWHEFYERGREEFDTAIQRERGNRVTIFAYLSAGLELAKSVAPWQNKGQDESPVGSVAQLKGDWERTYNGLRISLSGDENFESARRAENLSAQWQAIWA